MSPIRTDHSRKSGKTVAPVPRATFSGFFLLASGLSTSLLIAMTGFTVAMTLIWPG
ncbi:MAG: hypothetical protein ACRCS0_07865 [Albidovulum sp.]